MTETLRERNLRYKNESRARKRAAGICLDCPNPALPTRVRCRACLDKDQKSSRKWNQKCLEDGRCGRCGRPIAEDGYTTACPICSGRTEMIVLVNGH